MKHTKKSVYDIITERVIELLEDGTVPWHKPWSGGAGGMPQNLKSKRAYRGVNTFLLACAPYGSPYWLTYKQAMEKGGNVKKGERGWPVVFWKWIEAEKTDDGETQKKAIPMLRYYRVFNIEQCEGMDAPAVPRPDNNIPPIERCEQVVDKMPNKPRIFVDGNRAFYAPHHDFVKVPSRACFSSSEEFYSTLFHELSHSTGHKTRVGRFGSCHDHNFGSSSYSKEELVAEMGATFLCGHCNIENKTIDNSVAYISSWLKRLRGDTKLVVLAAAQAQKAADYILGKKYEEGGK